MKNSTVSNVTLINLESLPLEELCIAEILHEEFQTAIRKGQGDQPIALTLEKLGLAKIKEKRLEKTKTGKISTTVPPGTFGIADVHEFN